MPIVVRDHDAVVRVENLKHRVGEGAGHAERREAGADAAHDEEFGPRTGDHEPGEMRVAVGAGERAAGNIDEPRAERETIDEDHRIGAERGLERSPVLKAVCSGKIIIIADEEEKIIGRGRVERGGEGEAFPFFGERVAVAGRAVVQPEFQELSVVVEVDQDGGRGGCDGRGEHAVGGDGGAGRVEGGAGDIRGAGEIVDEDGAVEGGGRTGAAAVAVAREHEKLAAAEHHEFTDGGDLLHAGLGVEGQRQDPLALECGGGGIGNVVGEEARVAAQVAATGAAVLARRGLHERVEGAAVDGRGEALEALIVFSTRGGLAG